MTDRTFKAVFCECFGCPAERFQDELFRRCLSPSVRPVAWLVRSMRPGYFYDDLEYLRQVGETTTGPDFWRLATGIRYELSLNEGWLRRGFRLRICGKRLLKVYEEITKRQGEPFPT